MIEKNKAYYQRKVKELKAKNKELDKKFGVIYTIWLITIIITIPTIFLLLLYK